MPLKSFTLGSSLALCLALTVSATSAQTPDASPVAREKVGYVRFWDMLPLTNGGFILRKAESSAASSGFAISAKSYRYSGYVELPSGSMRLGVYKDTAPNTVLKTFDIDLKPATFFTVLVGPQASGGGGIELIDDTVYPKMLPGTLTIRNFFPGLTVSVGSGAQKIAQDLAYGQSYTAKGLASAVLPLTLATRLPNGTPAQSGSEVDFKNTRRATVLIIPDSYGRFRPRVVSDGSVD